MPQPDVEELHAAEKPASLEALVASVLQEQLCERFQREPIFIEIE